MIRILLADDHALFRAGLKRIMAEEYDMRVEGEAATASPGNPGLASKAIEHHHISG